MADQNLVEQLTNAAVASTALGNDGADDRRESSEAQPQPSNTKGEGRVVKRRNRQPVSCDPCRARRSKCSRGHPCDTCIKRNEIGLCVYAPPVNKHHPHQVTPGHGNGEIRQHSASGAQHKLQQLEAMVMQLVQNGDNAQARLTSTPQSQNGYMPQGETEQSQDHSAPHWQAILNGFQELRSSMDHQATPESPDNILEAEDRPVMLGANPPPSMEYVLRQYQAEMQDMDRRLQSYFQAPYMTLPVIHRPQFEAQYRQFCQDPVNQDPIWVALLFAVLAISAHITVMERGEPEAQMQTRYMQAAAQCLNLGGYTQPKKHLIPALIVLAQSEYLKYFDPCREASLLIGMAARLAYQSGLHREPPASCSPFEGEMRRRQWIALKHFDLQIACQFGVPTAIPYNSYDVAEPRDLLEEDLQEQATTLPPSRTPTESTKLTSFIIKHRIMDVLSEVYHLALSVRTDAPQLDENTVERLDRELRLQHANIPDTYKITPVIMSAAAPDYVVMGRLVCEFLVQKSLCILHRRQMAKGNEASRSKCIAAASKIVYELTDFAANLKPGMPMQGRQWMLSSVIVNDFLLACMVLCMGVTMDDRSGSRKTLSTEKHRERQQQLDLLRRAASLCNELSVKSRGAGRVCEAINLLLSRLSKEATSVDPSLGRSSAPTTANAPMSNMPTTFMPPQSYPTPSSTDSYMRSSSTGAEQQHQQANHPYTNMAPMPHPPVPIDYSNVNYDPVQGQGQSGLQNAPTVDPFEKFMSSAGDGGNVPDVDWTAFDQYITAGDVAGWDQALYDDGMGGRGSWGMN